MSVFIQTLERRLDPGVKCGLKEDSPKHLYLKEEYPSTVGQHRWASICPWKLLCHVLVPTNEKAIRLVVEDAGTVTNERCSML